jgi:hypothetical protein
VSPAANVALWGALAMAAWVCGLFFLRYWRRNRERFFLFFMLSFWAMAANWLLLALTKTVDEPRHGVYVVRLLAFLLILAGIVDKNRRR